MALYLLQERFWKHYTDDRWQEIGFRKFYETRVNIDEVWNARHLSEMHNTSSAIGDQTHVCTQYPKLLERERYSEDTASEKRTHIQDVEK